MSKKFTARLWMLSWPTQFFHSFSMQHLLVGIGLTRFEIVYEIPPNYSSRWYNVSFSKIKINSRFDAGWFLCAKGSMPEAIAKSFYHEAVTFLCFIKVILIAAFCINLIHQFLPKTLGRKEFNRHMSRMCVLCGLSFL